MINSSLVTYTNITNDRNSPRNHKIDTITIHCYVGQVTAKQGCDFFKTSGRDVSSNYVVGYDGSIGLSVPESDRAWTSSNATNDHRAITIETACDKESPYAVTDKAYNALINLVADVCKRNGIKKLVWSNSKDDRVNHRNGCNMTIHRDFVATACPGDFLMNHMADIANKVNGKLGNTDSKPADKVFTSSEYLKKGDKGIAVYALKRMLMSLKEKGIITQNVDDNDVFGEGTKTAVKQAQKASGIDQDGFVGVITIRSIAKLLSK